MKLGWRCRDGGGSCKVLSRHVCHVRLLAGSLHILATGGESMSGQYRIGRIDYLDEIQHGRDSMVEVKPTGEVEKALPRNPLQGAYFQAHTSTSTSTSTSTFSLSRLFDWHLSGCHHGGDCGPEAAADDEIPARVQSEG